MCGGNEEFRIENPLFAVNKIITIHWIDVMHEYVSLNFMATNT